MTKILFFTGVPIDDAATLHRSGLVAKKLKDKGYQIVFTSVSGNFKKRETKKVSGLPVIFIGQAHYQAKKPFSTRKRLGLGKALIENIKTCRQFAQVLQEKKPDRVLVVTSMPISLMAGLVSKIFGFKTFIDIEDLVTGQMEAAGYPQFLVEIYGLIEKIWLKIFDKVGVCSHYLQKRFPGSILLPNMIEVDLWKRTSLRQDFAGQRKIIFVGQMGAYHGQMEVLQGLIPILRKNKNLMLIFVGGGEMMENLKLKIKNEKLGNQVILTGQLFQNKVRKILNTADIGLLPHWDTPVHQARHPLKLLEYLASGLVVITNSVGEAAKQIKDKENGILCPPGDIDCLTKKTEMILANPNLAKRISQKATASVQAFSIKKILPKWIKFLE